MSDLKGEATPRSSSYVTVANAINAAFRQAGSVEQTLRLLGALEVEHGRAVVMHALVAEHLISTIRLDAMTARPGDGEP